MLRIDATLEDSKENDDPKFNMEFSKVFMKRIADVFKFLVLITCTQYSSKSDE